MGKHMGAMITVGIVLIVVLIVIGLFVGGLAASVTKGCGYQVLAIVLGPIGALIGVFVFGSLFERGPLTNSMLVRFLIYAVIGACILIAIGRARNLRVF